MAIIVRMLDIRFAMRRLLATPGFFAAAVLTLALGMGANALMFSVVNGLVLRPLPFHEPDDLVWVFGRQPEAPDEHDTLSGGEGELLARRTSPFVTTAAIGDAGLVREAGARHERWLGIWATTSLFDVLRIAPVAGSSPASLPADGSPRAILISHERWTRDFNGDPSIAGRPISFADNKHFVIAGVLPRGLEFPFARAPHKGHGAGFRAGVQDFWILAPDAAGGHPGGVMLARLAPGQTAGTAAREVTRLAARLPEPIPGRTYVVLPMRDQVLGMIRPALPVLQLFSLLVLLIACANLANLMLARAAAARTATAVRVALGATRLDLLRLFAAEALVMSIGGAAAGLALAWAGRDVLAAMAPRHAALMSRISIDEAVLLFLTAVAMLTTLVFGVLPGLRRGAGSFADMLTSSRHTGRGTQRTLRGLAVSQIALSLALLTGAWALHDSLRRVMDADAGYVSEGVISAETLLYIPSQQAIATLDTLVARLESLPFVEAAGFVHSTPLTGKWVVRDTFEVMDGPAAGVTPSMPGAFVSHAYFEVMRIPVLAGRAFETRDYGRRDFPIIINDVAARRFFPGRNPVGQRVRMTGRMREIAGVVKATRDLRLDAPPEPQWYQPGLNGSSELLVRVSGDPADRIAALRKEIESADPRLMLQRIDALDAIAADSVLERRMASSLVSVFAGIALALAALGLFGVMHVGVVRRRREFAIRSALGASRANILRGVVARSVLLAAAGIAIGVAVSLGVAGLLQRLMYETTPASAAALLVSALVLLAMSVLASIQPAWRAASADPASALKPE